MLPLPAIRGSNMLGSCVYPLLHSAYCCRAGEGRLAERGFKRGGGVSDDRAYSSAQPAATAAACCCCCCCCCGAATPSLPLLCVLPACLLCIQVSLVPVDLQRRSVGLLQPA
jgi:hypothetical protein